MRNLVHMFIMFAQSLGDLLRYLKFSLMLESYTRGLLNNTIFTESRFECLATFIIIFFLLLPQILFSFSQILLESDLPCSLEFLLELEIIATDPQSLLFYSTEFQLLHLFSIFLLFLQLLLTLSLTEFQLFVKLLLVLFLLLLKSLFHI